MNQLQKKYEGKAHFVYVYIEEAHADDEWPLSTTFCIKQHKTTEERVTAANMLVNEFGSHIPVLVDSMANEFNTKYSVWPERYFIVTCDSALLYVASPTTEFGFDRAEIDTALQRLTNPAPVEQQTALNNNNGIPVPPSPPATAPVVQSVQETEEVKQD